MPPSTFFPEKKEEEEEEIPKKRPEELLLLLLPLLLWLSTRPIPPFFWCLFLLPFFPLFLLSPNLRVQSRTEKKGICTPRKGGHSSFFKTKFENFGCQKRGPKNLLAIKIK